MKSTDFRYFPFPFTEDSYRYSNDLKPLENPVCIEITPEYETHIRRKREMLDKEHKQRFQSFPHSIDAQWEVLELLVDMAAEGHPEHFSVEKNGNNWTFRNHILGEEEKFVFRDIRTIPYEPMDFIGRHFHNDFILVNYRDGDLYLDAGQISFAALFSVYWNLGMTFKEIHAPVPFVTRDGIPLADRVRDFLLRMEPGKPWTRINWNLMAGHWDVNYEKMDVWGPDRFDVTMENAGELIHLRVEEQKFYRLPRCNAVLFVLNTQFLQFKDYVKNPAWLERTYKVLSDIPPEMAEYKGIAPFLEVGVQYLGSLLEQVKAGEGSC